MNAAPSSELRSQFGDIDIYLFDQLLRGRFDGRRRILDAGCSDRFVVDVRYLLDRTAALGGTLLDPIKTTNVQQQRCMTTWVVQKSHS